ncbi:AsmA family protein [Prolixibacteraceae bacterium JC049]|nr:AsmA family protein [Prolixibacteraceae bacterium JC049]
MKKLLIGLLALFILIVGLLAVVPILFEKQITEKARATLSEAVDAEIRFSSLDISLFKRFPNAHLQLNNLFVSGLNGNKTDSLFVCNQITTNVGLKQLFSGKLTVEHLTLHKPKVILSKKNDGKSNWGSGVEESAPKSKDIEVTDKKKPSTLGVKVKELKIVNGSCIYIDESSKQKVLLKGINTTMSGDIKGDDGNLKFKTDASLDVIMDGAHWYENTAVSVDTQLKLLYQFTGVEFDYLNLSMNGFPLAIKGRVINNPDTSDFSLEISSKKTSLKELLQTVPSVYAEHLASYPMGGEVMLKGSVEGVMMDESYPSVDFQLLLKEGTVSNKKVQLLNGINSSVSLILPGGDMNQLTINVSRFKANMSGNPLNLQFKMVDPMNKGAFNFHFDGYMDMAKLHQLIPENGNVLEGTLTGKLDANGELTHINNEQYDKIKTDGLVQLKDFKIKNPNISKAFVVDKASVKINSNQIALSGFSGSLGQSNFNAKGMLSNFYGYLFKNEVLKGNLNVNAPLINLNEFLSLSVNTGSPADSVAVDSTKTSDQYSIPSRIQFKTSLSAQKVIFDDLLMERVKGNVTVANSALALRSFSTDMLGGNVNMSGKIVSAKNQTPHFDLKWNASKLNIKQAWQSLKLFRKFVPIAAKSTGAFSTRMSISGQMNNQWQAVTRSLNGNGVFATHGVSVVDSKTMSELGKVINTSKMNRVDIDDFNAQFTITEGALIVPPFKTKVAKQPMVISGKKTFDDQLDFNVAVDLDRQLLKGDYNNLLALLPGSENMKTINADIKITGNVAKPVVKLDITRARKQIKQQLKKTSIKDWTKKLKGLFK